MAVFAREILKSFYSVIKNSDAYIRFAFLTGVTKFSKVSVFSGINNIVDISLEKPYGTICGYTQRDLETVFAKHLEDVDMEQVRLWYDGYNFLGDHVYNPFDILLFIAKEKKFKSYWFETATPTFLIKLLKKQRFFLPNLNNIKAGEELLTSFDIDKIDPVTLLFQAGYLTIKAAIHALFAAIPYHNYTNNDIARYEGFYASVIFAWLSSIGVVLIVEDCTNKGRIDMSVEMNETIYLIEFKVDMPEQKNLAQIKSKGYAEKYQTKGKKIVMIGICFSSAEKNVTEFIWGEEF